MILVIGGARSGKSSLAQRMAAEAGGRVCFVATAEGRDAEMRDRIRRHRESRAEDWETLELEQGIRLCEMPAHAEVVLFDCFTVFLSNLMASRGLDWTPEDEDLMPEAEVLRRMEETEEEALRLVERLGAEAGLLLVVSNEVGMGLVPPFRLGRIFRDLAGRLNQRLAEQADEVILVVAGLPLRLKAGKGGEDADA